MKMVAEPSIVAKKLPVADEVSKVEGTVTDNTVTYFNTNTAGIRFYPAYKMFAGNKDAWLLGKEQRVLKAVNVAQISVLNENPVLDIASTWSRDKADSGKRVMKSGYNYKLTGKEPMDLKVVTYTVVPKVDWVKDGKAIRKELLENHNILVGGLKEQTNYMFASNLPEAYSTSAPSEWQVNNPYRKGENVEKCRMKEPANINVTSTVESPTIMSLESLDSAFSGNVDNAKRLKDQLEQNSWYQEHFNGFEVVKQVTIIHVKFNQSIMTNFVRNGGNNYDDLATTIHNIKASNGYGMEMICYNPKAQWMGNEISVHRLTPPTYFHVRGTSYDDRTN